MKGLYAFQALVGSFRSSGYFALQPYLQKILSVKILVGINVDQMFAEAQRKGMMFYDKMTEEELKQYLQTHFSKESTSCEWKEFKNLKHIVKGHE